MHLVSRTRFEEQLSFFLKQKSFRQTTAVGNNLFRGVASNQTLGGPERSSGRSLLFFVPTSDSLVSISELKGLFELTWRPSRAVDSPCALHLELRIHNDTIRCDGLGAKVPGKRQEQLTQTLNVHLLKKPKIEGPLAPLYDP